ncbi:hypothetical protein GLOIN_2v1786727 [Rhizophagus irregularis DAOM 181602=DAOM 197198]|uniref:Uncharacterized protein n=1 Tax=Rhizophagus irregularis (strain DAOM 181602 / DAOM 197198 / MUCL 43194) TaxID=747089 RepID=A0A2P4P7J6_RHIID|nr:hypothetical protein GLOIN_2v1786727 [Rhizophagus irregularis DAOM 181602=DAOM 197198]POG61359.1 hypothetical protein GLOIN_2v1786727 [Rhizophagus irregularis DAOM 181602=DAOM 197198]|eukprot:XP_025168225.1 hypothetical protein GLOIN_2v1786727 [Rhizophagus irregularis DAOM 181602=DAOM 197198]
MYQTIIRLSKYCKKCLKLYTNIIFGLRGQSQSTWLRNNETVILKRFEIPKILVNELKSLQQMFY